MKKTSLVIMIGGLLLIAAGCHKKMHRATDKTVMKVNEEQKDYTPAQLAKGEEIFRGNCSKCHKFHEPAEFEMGKWNRVLPSMIGKAKLNSSDAGLVTAWIKTNAKS